MCVRAKERKDTHRTHSFYHLTHSDSCCWGKRRNGSNMTPPNGASHSKQPQFNRERNISFFPFNAACSSRAKGDPYGGRGSLRLPFLIFLILSITETVFTREKRTAALGPRDSSCNITRLIVFFFHVHILWGQKHDNILTLRLSGTIYRCAFYG